jgi:hypothetical protein
MWLSCECVQLGQTCLHAACRGGSLDVVKHVHECSGKKLLMRTDIVSVALLNVFCARDLVVCTYDDHPWIHKWYISWGNKCEKVQTKKMSREVVLRQRHLRQGLENSNGNVQELALVWLLLVAFCARRTYNLAFTMPLVRATWRWLNTYVIAVDGRCRAWKTRYFV